MIRGYLTLHIKFLGAILFRIMLLSFFGICLLIMIVCMFYLNVTLRVNVNVYVIKTY